jgi:hypothetical protein
MKVLKCYGWGEKMGEDKSVWEISRGISVVFGAGVCVNEFEFLGSGLEADSDVGAFTTLNDKISSEIKKIGIIV